MIKILNIIIIVVVLTHNKFLNLKASSLYILVNLEAVWQQKYEWPRTNLIKAVSLRTVSAWLKTV